MRIAPSLQLTDPERQQLTQWTRGRRTPVRLVLRAKIALLAAEGHTNQHIATALDTSRETVGLWRHRVVTQRLPGLAQDAPRGGRPPKPRQALIARILKTTTQVTPPDATHWSTRTLARYLGTNSALVQRVWTAHGLQPRRVRTFKLSQDPHFQDKLEDVVGLYLHPPEHAVVLSVDEKSQIQALERTQPDPLALIRTESYR
ncbi:MAG: IS630 family transposase [Nitrospira sp.]|nr:IS630 family transposase [Nitrospira sp.]